MVNRNFSTNKKYHVLSTASYIAILTAIIFLSSLYPVIAYGKTSVSLGSRWGVNNPTELELDSSITAFIAEHASKAGFTAYNWYGSETSRDNIFEAARGAGDTFTIVFYIGHGYKSGALWWINWFIVDDSGNKVYDYEIFNYSGCRNVRFVLLWSCYQGDTIGGTQPITGKPYGMPYAWLHTTDLSSDGYTNPDGKGYAFIGFTGAAPYLNYSDPPFDEDKTGHQHPLYLFLLCFYEHLLDNGYSIKEALDQASMDVWHCIFKESPLYKGYTIDSDTGRMVVYGDGDLKVVGG